MKRRFLMFLAPEGDAGGGGAAVAERPGSMGERAAAQAKQNDPLAGDKPAAGLEHAAMPWKDALERAEKESRGEETSSKDNDKSGKEDDASKDSKGEKDGQKKDDSTKSEPSSAFDAQFDGVTDADKGKSDEQRESLLKDLPETLPREGRSDHWTRARGAIEKLETTLGERNKAVSDLTAQLEAAKASPADATQRIAQLEKELGEWKDLAVAANIDLDPQIREKYVVGRQNKVTKAANKLNAYGGDGSALAKALDMPEGKVRIQAIKEALGDLETDERVRIMGFVAEVEQLDDELADIKKNPQPEWEKLQKAENEKRQKKQAEKEEFKKNTFNSVVTEMPKELFLLRKVPDSVKGAAKANALIDEIRDGAYKMLSPDATPVDLVKTALWGKAGPHLQEMVTDLNKQLKAALATIKGYEEGSPAFRGDRRVEKQKSDADLTAGEIFLREMAKAQSAD